jgi:hypothetical protein
MALAVCLLLDDRADAEIVPWHQRKNVNQRFPDWSW